MERDADGRIICPYNMMCRCDVPECHSCGWHPEVAKHRKAELRKKMGVGANLYKIPFTGYCEVWADSAEDAVERADHDNMFFAKYDFGDPVCVDEEEDDELD
jgi:hypothetical protein